MQSPFGIQLLFYHAPSKSAEDYASFEKEIKNFLDNTLKMVKGDVKWQWPYGMFFFEAQNGISLFLTTEESAPSKIDIAQTQAIVGLLEMWTESDHRGAIPSVGEVAVWSDGWKQIISQGRLSMAPLNDEGGASGAAGGENAVLTTGQAVNKTQRAWFRYLIGQSVDSTNDLRLPLLSVPQDGWKREEGDFELTMTEYKEPKGDPIILNFYFIPHLVNWVMTVITSGGGEKSMDDDWPHDVPVSHTFVNFEFKLEPVERQPPVKFTVGEVVDAMNLFQAWAFAWSGGDAHSAPSATLTVRSIEWGEILAKGTFKYMANQGNIVATF